MHRVFALLLGFALVSVAPAQTVASKRSVGRDRVHAQVKRRRIEQLQRARITHPHAANQRPRLPDLRSLKPFLKRDTTLTLTVYRAATDKMPARGHAFTPRGKVKKKNVPAIVGGTIAALAELVSLKYDVTFTASTLARYEKQIVAAIQKDRPVFEVTVARRAVRLMSEAIVSDVRARRASGMNGLLIGNRHRRR